MQQYEKREREKKAVMVLRYMCVRIYINKRREDELTYEKIIRKICDDKLAQLKYFLYIYFVYIIVLSLSLVI